LSVGLVAANGKVIKKTKQPARSRLIPGAQVLNITQRDPLNSLMALGSSTREHDMNRGKPIRMSRRQPVEATLTLA
jgi:hypothetical protein